MVSRETTVNGACIYSVFPDSLFEDFGSGTSLNQLTADAAALFLYVAAQKLKTNVFISFKSVMPDFMKTWLLYHNIRLLTHLHGTNSCRQSARRYVHCQKRLTGRHSCL